MSKRLLIRGAKQLLTLHGPAVPRRGGALGDLGIIPDGSLLIDDGIITEVGPSRRVENLAAARDADVIDASGCVVMPGFVDSHTHLVCGPPRLSDFEMRLAGRTYHEIAEAGGGIMLSVRHVRNTALPKLLHSASKVLRHFVRHGTTSVEAKTGYGLDESSEWKVLRALAELDGRPLDIVPTYLGAHIVPPEFHGRGDSYVEWVCTSMMPRIQKKSLARFADIYCDRGAFTLDQTRRYLQGAREHGLLLKVHGEQFEHTGAAQLAAELGAASADHLEQATEDDARALAKSQTIATLLPGSVYFLGLRTYAPARLLIESGAAVALATDYNPGTSPTCSMPMILSLACTEMRMSPAEAISAATINGAHALRMADRVGSLEFGKEADILVVAVPDYREIPYHFGANLVAITIKRGEVLYHAAEVAGFETN
jgi:imidazolonepropionase